MQDQRDSLRAAAAVTDEIRVMKWRKSSSDIRVSVAIFHDLTSQTLPHAVSGTGILDWIRLCLHGRFLSKYGEQPPLQGKLFVPFFTCPSNHTISWNRSSESEPHTCIERDPYCDADVLLVKQLQKGYGTSHRLLFVSFVD